MAHVEISRTEAETALKDELRYMNWRAANVMSVVAIMLIVGSVPFDVLLIPEQFGIYVKGRVIIGICCLLALVMFRRLDRHKRCGEYLSLTVFFICGFGLSVLLQFLPTGHSYYAMLNLIYLGTMIIPWDVKKSVLTCSIILVAYASLPMLTGKPLDVQFVSNVGFQFEIIIIVGVATFLNFIKQKNEIRNRLMIEKQARDLENRDRYKREFISNITHELKTPLSMVIGNAELIMDDAAGTNKTMVEHSRMIQQAAFQLSNHVDRIISVATVEDPENKLSLETYDYRGIVANVCSMFKAKAQEEKVGFTVKNEGQPIIVSVDIVRVEEILNNLIQNAFKFTRAGGAITVIVGADGQYAHTEVVDTGIGIPRDKQDKVFERLYQADSPLSKRHAGIGIGLYLCKKNVELHGGIITVHSVEGKGTTFGFTLPLYADQTADVKNKPFDGDERRQRSRRSGADRRMEERRKAFEYRQNIGLEDLAKITWADNIRDYEDQLPGAPAILIVEDNAGMMKVIVEALRHEYNLFLALNAFEALDKLKAHGVKVSLILSDIMMPGMSGYDFCKSVMDVEEWKRIPLIFITALMREEDQLRGLSLGATDYIVKPYNIKILKEKIAYWISRRGYELLLKDVSASLENRIEQASKVKDIILHEIKNPLQIITGANFFMDRLGAPAAAADPKQGEKFRKYMDLLKKGTEALQTVVETSKGLDVSSMAERKVEDMEVVFQEVLAQTRHLTAGVECRTDLSKLDGVPVLCDRRMLVQVFVNLVRNAAEAIAEMNAGDKGSIRIYGYTVDSSVAVAVADNGAGMDEATRERIFQFKFTTKKDGTGIGLHLSKMLVKLHGGSIEVESQKGKGSTFTVYLPVHRFAAGDLMKQDGKREDGAGDR